MSADPILSLMKHILGEKCGAVRYGYLGRYGVGESHEVTTLHHQYYGKTCSPPKKGCGIYSYDYDGGGRGGEAKRHCTGKYIG